MLFENLPFHIKLILFLIPVYYLLKVRKRPKPTQRWNRHRNWRKK